MARSDWLNQLLGGIAGTGQGLTLEKQRAMAKAKADADESFRGESLRAQLAGQDIVPQSAVPQTHMERFPVSGHAIGMEDWDNDVSTAGADPTRYVPAGTFGGQPFVKDLGLTPKTAPVPADPYGGRSRDQWLKDMTDAANANRTPARPADPYDGRTREQWLADEKARADAGYHAPRETGDHYTTYQDTDPATGKPRTMRLNTNTGATEEIGGGRGSGASAGGGGGQGQNIQARLIGAVSEGRLSDERMSAYEAKHLKDGKLDVGTLKQIGGNFATGLAGAHDPFSIMVQGAGEGLSNLNDPEYLQYMRDARLIARAEQLMSARGGSEAMASDNAFLARGGANAPEATVMAAQKTRRALFGKMGAVMQTMTPQQAEKLNAGLAALMSDDDKFDYSGIARELGAGTDVQPVVGPANPPPAQPVRQPLATSDKVMARRDPAFAAHLKTLGYTDADWK